MTGGRQDRGSDVVVVGSGHAAVEASLAASRTGNSVVMVTIDPDNIAGLPCNPAFGGPGKAQIISEVDALGGEIGLAVDDATVEMRVLNASKGPAVRSLRAQVDKRAYSDHMRNALYKAGIRVVGGMVVDVLTGRGKACGVRLAGGQEIAGGAVILCTGVYLESRTIMGEVIRESGPLGEPSSKGLSSSLVRLGLKMTRFKTGTSPRVARDSVAWNELRREEGSSEPLAFSFVSTPRTWEIDACYSTYTSPATHETIRRNRGRAPLFNGTIEGVGPRYCPSIESKVMRFPERTRHQVFLEIESKDGPDVYILGLSTSLPIDVQVEMVRSLPGLRDARITRPGYAIEYDCLVPWQIKPTLELKQVPGLFSAGQINGTSGYEEAAAQGLVAGVNAGAYLLGKEPLVLGRDEAYVGVLLDDLTGTAIEEPYRMLTSRAEYRLLLRQSNADLRLTPRGRAVGLVDDHRWLAFREKSDLMERGRALLDEAVDGMKIRDSLRNPKFALEHFLGKVPGLADLPVPVLSELEIEAKYAGFIDRQRREAGRLARYAAKKIPTGLDPGRIPGLSAEAREKLARHSPATIGRAIDAGVSPSDALILLAYLREGR